MGLRDCYESFDNTAPSVLSRKCSHMPKINHCCHKTHRPVPTFFPHSCNLARHLTNNRASQGMLAAIIKEISVHESPSISMLTLDRKCLHSVEAVYERNRAYFSSRKDTLAVHTCPNPICKPLQIILRRQRRVKKH